MNYQLFSNVNQTLLEKVLPSCGNNQALFLSRILSCWKSTTPEKYSLDFRLTSTDVLIERYKYSDFTEDMIQEKHFMH